MPLSSDRVQTFLNGAIALSLGLAPTLHLVALQLATILILVSVLVQGRSNFSEQPKLLWLHVLLGQFALYFMLNAVLYPSLEGNMRHFQRVALESWSITLVGLGLMWLFVNKNRDFINSIQRWVPLGLVLSFAIMSYFFFGPQGHRAQAFSTNTLVPPIWFLVLTLICFCDFYEMPKPAQIFRGALLILAGIMTLYSGGRAILAIWLICTACLGAFLIVTRPNTHRPLRDLTYLLLGLLALIGLLYIADAAMGGTLDMRIRYTLSHLNKDGLSSTAFFRLELWAAARDIIASYWPMGAGQVNERLLIHEIVERDWWFRAHQTYMSYLIAGGILALISGLLFQAAALWFCTRALFPAALGLFAVPALSGLTDSIFQSFFSVQLYMLLVFLVSGRLLPKSDNPA